MKRARHALDRCPTDISGIDEIMRGGFSKDRLSLVSGGGSACGNAVPAIEFHRTRTTRYDKPGVFEKFEKDMVEGFAILNFYRQTDAKRY